MSFFLSLVFFGLVIGYLVLTFRADNTSLKNFFLPALLIKCAAGVCVGLVYIHYYKTGDTLLFFENAALLTELAKSDPYSYFSYIFNTQFANNHSAELYFSDQRAILMVKIVSLFSLVSLDNYWLISIYMSIVSFLGSWYLVKQIHHSFEKATEPAMIAFLFFPSITFWTSGLIKETLAMAGLYFLSGIVIRLWFRDRVSIPSWVMAFLSTYLLWNLKYYFAGVFFAIIGATLIYRFVALRNQHQAQGWKAFSFWMGIFLIIIFMVTFLHPNFKFNRLLGVMVENYKAFHALSNPNDVIHFRELEPTLTSMVLNSPKALFSGLFRPLFFDANNIFAVALSIENFLLVVLSLIAIRNVSKLFTSNVSVLLGAIVVYVILLAIFITLSTPNFGTLARYRVGYLPFFVFLILLVPPIAIRLQKAFNIPAKP